MLLENKISGLTDEEVKQRIKEGKVNIDESKPEKTFGSILIKNVFTLFNLINVILAISVFLVGSYKNMLFIGVVFFNTIIGIVQEMRSKKAVDKLTILTGSNTKVYRNNKLVKISNEEIVLDDVIFLERGNQIPADCEIISGECYVNESLLTGESELIKKTEKDKLLSGSFINSGNCYARAVSVGSDKYASQLNNSAKYYKQINSEILFTIRKIIKVCTCILVPLGALLFINQFFILNGTLESAVVKTVAALIGMIPEGLVLLTSTVLAVSVVRLSRRKVLVQDLYCIETLARVDVLCLDKTGTLTCDEMTVEDVIPFDGVEIDEVNTVLSNFANNSLDYNSTMNAVRDYVAGYEFEKADSIVPFSSEKKSSSVTIGNTKLICGAGEFILNSDEENYLNQIKKYQENYRVLTFISLEENKRRIICSVLLKDKLRKNAKETLDYFKKQDVTLKIISGDSVNTIVNIAKEFKIDGYNKAVDCSTLKTQEDIKSAAEKYTIFGRVTPQQKEMLVKALHDNDHSVAMTGDGVNDVLALKMADCSVAMASGSEAAKCVSQIVLADDDFSSMPHIVAEGRRTIHNIQRSSSLFLVKNIFSILLSIIVICCGVPYPFQSIQLSFIGGLTIGIPSFILALEYNNSRIKENFFVNIITGALPAGLTITLNVVLITMFGTTLGLSPHALETVCVMITAFTLFVLVVKISLPFNKLRFALVSFIFVALIIGFTFANEFINTIILDFYSFIIMLLFFAISIVVFAVLTKIANIVREKIVQSKDN
jgi:cation-transporting ATPase E